MLYTPECFVEHPKPPSAAAPAAKDKAKDGEKKETPAGEGSPRPTEPSASAAAKPEPSPSSGGEKEKETGGGEAGKDKGSSSPSLPTAVAAAASAATTADGEGGKAPAADPAAGSGNSSLAVAGVQRKPKPVYYGVDEARKRVALKCTSCEMQGALIGCHVQSCSISTHFACARREGWKFGEPDADGKLFLCGMHRNQGQVRFERKSKAPAKKGPRKSGESVQSVRPKRLSVCLSARPFVCCFRCSRDR